MQNNTNTPEAADKQREYVETFVEFYADFLRCLDEGVYKPKEGWEILAEECHYLYHTITKWDKEKEQD